MIMKIVSFVFLVLLNEVLSTGNKEKEHVHFKIHVPEIIKHHIHTKTVFIHVHKTIPKKKSPPKKHHEEHHEDWSSWSSYDHHEEDKYGDEHGKGHKEHKGHDYKWPDYKDHYDYGHKTPDHKDYGHYDYGKDEHKNHKDNYFSFPAHDYLKNNHQGPHVGHTVGYSYPPQLSMHQPVKEMSHNDIEPYMNAYEEGYHKGYHSETTGEYSDELSKFHNDNHDEGDEHDAGYEDETYGKTNAGRYFVNEDEAAYDHDADNLESDKRRISSRIFGKKMMR